MKKTLLGTICALALSVSSAALAAEKVNIGAPAWTGAQAIAHLIQEIVVTRIGGAQHHLGAAEHRRKIGCEG